MVHGGGRPGAGRPLSGPARGRAAHRCPKLSVQYADYAAWQRRGWRARRGRRPRVLEAGARRRPAGLALPTDRPRPSVQTSRGGSIPFELPASLMRRLRALSRRESATPFMTLLTAFAVVLQRYADQDDLVIGAPIANRTRPELEPLIGFFVNTLALRADLSGDPTFREALARVRATCLGAYAHQELPFERLVEELHPKRDLSLSTALPGVVRLSEHRHAGAGPGRAAGHPLTLESATARFDLELQVFDRPDGLSGWFEYNADLFDGATIEQLSKALRILVEEIADAPDRPPLRAEPAHRGAAAPAGPRAQRHPARLAGPRAGRITASRRGPGRHRRRRHCAADSRP
ncbi:condensation domain-containing protein [Streptomyces sp. L7]